jgi:hypothetical protein
MWDCSQGGEPEGWFVGQGEKSSAKSEVKWLCRAKAEKDVDLSVLMTDVTGAQLAWPKGRSSDGDDSMDSVYEALMGNADDDRDQGMLDDTFAGRGRFT